MGSEEKKLWCIQFCVAPFFLTDCLEPCTLEKFFAFYCFCGLCLIRTETLIVIFCIIFSFSSSSKLCHHSSDWCRGGIYSPPEPHAADDSRCLSCSTHPGDPASTHQHTGDPASPHWDPRNTASTDRHTGNSLSNPNQHTGTSACPSGYSAASAGRKDVR